MKDYALKIWDAMKSYANELKTIAEDKLPDLVSNAEQLPGEAEDVRENAKDELNSLDLAQKAKAGLNIGLNLKMVAKVPGVIKSVLERLKTELMELKDAITDLKNNLVKLAKDALECISKKFSKPTECYKSSFGAIKYT